MERERLQNYVDNGEKAVPTFSEAEMTSPLDLYSRPYGAGRNRCRSVHAVIIASTIIPTSCICYFGRRYGLLVDHNIATSISAGIDGGQPWRRTFGGKNVTYTDWQKG